MFRVLVFLVPAFLTACESYDLGSISELRPTLQKDTYQWVTFGDVIYPESSAEAEAARLRQMDKALKKTAQCTDYRLLKREAVFRRQGLNGAKVHDIYYTVRC